MIRALRALQQDVSARLLAGMMALAVLLSGSLPTVIGALDPQGQIVFCSGRTLVQLNGSGDETSGHQDQCPIAALAFIALPEAPVALAPGRSDLSRPMPPAPDQRAGLGESGAAWPRAPPLS
ncbi:MAG: hypothetical protein MRY63_07030 [Neomegalonema sp.]|nr:hypothetical protein [Neomegalonema sp.]